MKMDPTQLDTLSDRLNYALKLTGTRQADLARAIDVKPQVINFLCSGQTKASRFCFEIATALGLNTRWLATGEGAPFLADDPSNQLVSECQKVKILAHEKLIRLAQDGSSDLSSIEAWAVCKTQEHNTYCTVLSDTSMEPFIHEGSRLFFKIINAYQPRVGDVVLAYLPKAHTVLIRKVSRTVQGGFELSPENTELFKSVMLTDDIFIVGMVFEVQWNLMRGDS